MSELTQQQAALLAFIRGEGHSWGKGITTHKTYGEGEIWDGQRRLHTECLELERLGLVRRLAETPDAVVWAPQEVDNGDI